MEQSYFLSTPNHERQLKIPEKTDNENLVGGLRHTRKDPISTIFKNTKNWR